MRCLSANKVPLKGSKGEKYRIEQFKQQLPEWDSNIDACHKMDDLDKKRMSKCIDRTKRRFFGVGSVDRVTAHETVVSRSWLIAAKVLAFRRKASFLAKTMGYRWAILMAHFENIAFYRVFHGHSEYHKIIAIKPTELKLWPSCQRIASFLVIFVI